MGLLRWYGNTGCFDKPVISLSSSALLGLVFDLPLESAGQSNQLLEPISLSSRTGNWFADHCINVDELKAPHTLWMVIYYYYNYYYYIINPVFYCIFYF